MGIIPIYGEIDTAYNIIKIMEYLMKKSLLLFSILTSIVIAACDNPASSSDDNTISIIPIVGFGSPVQSGRVSVPINTEEEQNIATYVLMAPLLTGFASVSDFTEDSDYSISVFDSFMDFEITVGEDSTIKYTGTMRDGSGELVVDYNSDSGTFSFTQTVFIQATATDVVQMNLVIYVTGSDISITPEGYFQGLYDIAYIQKDIDGGWELYTNTAEIYNGVMNPSGEVGTGIAICGDTNTDGSDKFRVYESEDSFAPGDYNAGMSIPSDVSKETMPSWNEYLSSSEILSLDTGGSSYSWTILYKLNGSSLTSLDDTSSNDPFTAFSDGFTQSDDLSSWRDKSLLLN